MRSRTLTIFIPLTIGLMLVGCGDTGKPPVVLAVTNPAAPAPPLKENPQFQIQPLTADQLARILGVNVWTARFSGGPIECWLEVEEEGQSTLPKRIPEKDFIDAGSVNPPTEGSIDMWWTQREDRQGGQLSIHAANGSYSYGLNKDALTFAWPGFGAGSTTIGKGELKTVEPGKDFVIIDYDANESLPDGSKKTPRRVHLKLMGRFPIHK